MVQDHAKKSKKPVVQQENEKRAKQTAKKYEAHSTPEKLARGAQTRKLHAADKELIRKPVAKSHAKLRKEVVSQKPLAREKKVQDHAKLPKQRNDAATSHRIMKRATVLSHKRGVLGSAEVSKGPFILELDDRKGSKRGFKPGKMFAHAKRNGNNRDIKAKNQKRKFHRNGRSLGLHPQTQKLEQSPNTA